MPLQLPYKRIARPFDSPNGNYLRSNKGSFLIDHDYAPDRTTAIRAFHGIQSDLCRCFEYIEPDDKNLNAFSTRLYEVFLRAATEFESNCKSILTANNYTGAGTWNMNDYKKIEAATHLSAYEIKLVLWADTPRIMQPLAPWSSGNSLTWYQGYNSVKHNRVAEFHLANLENTVEAVAALFAILFAQFSIFAFSDRGLISGYDRWNDWLTYPNSAFWVKVPKNWDIQECYGFQEGDLQGLNPKFVDFPF